MFLSRCLLGWLCLLNVVVMGQGYTLVGDAIQFSDDCYVVTQELEWENSAIWYNDPIDISEPFDLQFQMVFGGNDAGGADGMVFVMQQVGNDVLGLAGGGIGFEGFAPSLGVEFDTWTNGENGDPAYDHLSILLNGISNHGSPNNIAGPTQISPTGNNVEDNQFYIIDISWNPSTNSFSVFVNCQLRLSTTISLENVVFTNSNPIYWGFTGATGGNFNEQIICLDPFILGTPEEFFACAGEPTQLSAPSTNLGTISWEPAEFLDDPNSFTPIATVSETTTFTLTYEDLCGNQQVDETTLVVAEPSLDLGADFNLCAEEDTIIQVDASYEDVQWSNGDFGIFTTVTAPGTFYVDATLDGCAVSDTIEIFENPLPVYEGDLALSICQGDDFMLELGSDIVSVEWEDGNTDLDRVLNEAGTYNFTLSDGVCSSSFAISLDVIDVSSFSLGEDIEVCEDTPIQLEVGDGFDSVIWSDQTNETSLEVTESGTYFVDVSVGSCLASDTVLVTVNTNPTYNGVEVVTLCDGEEFEFNLGDQSFDIEWFDGDVSSTRIFAEEGVFSFDLSANDCISSFTFELDYVEIPEFDLGADVEICQGEEIFLSVNVEDAAVLWSTGSEDSNVLISNSGMFWAQTSLGDCTFSDTVLVGVRPNPSLNISGNLDFCVGEQTELLANTSSAVVWSTGEITQQIQVDQQGVYTVVATNQFDCSTQESVEVTRLDLPLIDRIRSVVKCEEESNVEVILNSNNDEQLIWSNGDIGRRSKIELPGEYRVTLTNICGSDTIFISVMEEECLDRFFMPNAFTPDGDGLNDIFKPIIGQHESFEMSIYSHTGEMVFESKDSSMGWNGSFQNGNYYCPSGLYTVILTVKFDEFDTLEDYGTVTLIR